VYGNPVRSLPTNDRASSGATARPIAREERDVAEPRPTDARDQVRIAREGLGKHGPLLFLSVLAGAPRLLRGQIGCRAVIEPGLSGHS
jgi:hypothetical protein